MKSLIYQKKKKFLGCSRYKNDIKGKEKATKREGWKEEEKAEKPEKRLERGVSHVLGQILYCISVTIPVVLQISMWT
jgi:hypothetical protein